MVKKKNNGSIIGDYMTILNECEDGKWYLLTKSTFDPGTIFNGLNSFREVQKEELKELLDSKN